MPPQRLPELREAVAWAAPGSLPRLYDEMQQAFTEAGEKNSVIPIRMFHHRWALLVAIERRPDIARRFHAAEQTVNGPDRATSDQAIREIADILRFVDNDVVAG